MHIIGITGMFGAGKGTVVDYLVKNKGFTHYSMSGFITEEIKSRGLPVNRDSMIVVANDLRTRFGVTHIIDSLYARAVQTRDPAIIESLRALGEVRRMKELGGIVLGVNADPHIRYERITKRKSEKDSVSFEEFLAQEKQEMMSDDPTRQNLIGALREADVIICNDGTVDDLHRLVEKALSELMIRA